MSTGIGPNCAKCGGVCLDQWVNVNGRDYHHRCAPWREPTNVFTPLEHEALKADLAAARAELERLKAERDAKSAALAKAQDLAQYVGHSAGHEFCAACKLVAVLASPESTAAADERKAMEDVEAKARAVRAAKERLNENIKLGNMDVRELTKADLDLADALLRLDWARGGR